MYLCRVSCPASLFSYYDTDLMPNLVSRVLQVPTASGYVPNYGVSEDQGITAEQRKQQKLRREIDSGARIRPLGGGDAPTLVPPTHPRNSIPTPQPPLDPTYGVPLVYTPPTDRKPGDPIDHEVWAD